jgi:hypothetical protein
MADNCTYVSSWKKMKKREHLDEQGVGSRTILK